MDCNTCKDNRKEPVPYIVHEGAMARQERTNKRLWIVVIILIAALILTNAAWIYREAQWEVVETTTTQEVEQTTDGNGDNNFVGGDYYGSAESENDNQNEVQNP